MKHQRSVLARLISVAPLFFALAACISSCGPYKKQGGTQSAQTFLPEQGYHHDLPIPVGARMLDQQRIPVGLAQQQGYQLLLKVHSAHLTATQLQNFYIAHLELHGWLVEPLMHSTKLICLLCIKPQKKCVVWIEPGSTKPQEDGTNFSIKFCLQEQHD